MDLNENTYRTSIDWEENVFQDQQSSSIQVKEHKPANEPSMEGLEIVINITSIWHHCEQLLLVKLIRHRDNFLSLIWYVKECRSPQLQQPGIQPEEVNSVSQWDSLSVFYGLSVYFKF